MSRPLANVSLDPGTSSLLRQAAAITLLTIPWLSPFAPGPWSAIVPWLTSVACVAVWLMLSGGDPRLTERSAAWSWALAALASAILGLLQYYGAAAWFAPWINVPPRVGDVFANLRQRNQFATLTTMGIATVFWWHARRAGRPRGWHVGACMLLAVGNAASASRTGGLQVLALLALALVWGDWRGRGFGALIAATGASYLLAPFVLPALAGLDPLSAGILGRLRTGDPLCASRTTLWANVLHLIALKPWSGWGWGELDHAHFITSFQGPRFCEILDNAHNLPLHVAVELGVPVATLCTLAITLPVLWLRPWRETDPARRATWAVLAMIALHSLLEYPLWYGPFQIAAILCVLILGSGRQTPVIPTGSKLAGIRLGCATLVMAGVAYVAWDYHRISQIYKPPALRSPAYREDTLAKLNDSWLFRNHVQFAELTTTRVTRENAAHVHALALRLLHFSPEPRVVEPLIDSALLLGRAEEARFYTDRLRAAFPTEYERWERKASHAEPASP